jgi:hypothetical protein
MKNAVFQDVTPMALVRTGVSEERSAYIIRVTRIDEIGTETPVLTTATWCNVPQDGIRYG